MGLSRKLLLAASQSRWMRERATRMKFVRKSVSRFMPGEALDDALRAGAELATRNLGTTLTHLGENVADAKEAQAVTDHYQEVLRRIAAEQPRTEISVKLTQLGLDLSEELCEKNLRVLLAACPATSGVFVDMEYSQYVDATLRIYRRVLADFPRTGICLQAYLPRTADDLRELLPLRPSVRLVKGAYSEPPSVALQQKRAIDDNYLALAQELLCRRGTGEVTRVIFASHDAPLIARITRFAELQRATKESVEFQMLYGIRTDELARLSSEGWPCSSLIAYGEYWYPWFVRRLAERPANVWFVLKNLT